MRELYLDCSRGAAGDMLAGALLELFSDSSAVIEELNALGIPGVRFAAEKRLSHGIGCTAFKVCFNGQEEQQDEPAREHGHHEYGHVHAGEHQHGHEHEHHHQHHSLADIFAVVDTLPLSEKSSSAIKEVYKKIAQAEATVHRHEMSNIHFHELGTMDALADITAVCLMMEKLAPERVVCSSVCTGFGTVRCAHGELPVPAPATALLLRGIPTFPGNISGEMCTPTGAALIAHFATGFGNMPAMTTQAVGYGAGSKELERLNCVRALLGESGEHVVELCCNVDDMTPEDIGFAIDSFFKAGALDAGYLPMGMKKNRPGVVLMCLCREEQRDEMVELFFKNTSTIGIRESLCRRYVLRRESRTVTTPYGPVRLKYSEGYGVTKCKAEFDDLSRISHDTGLSLADVRALIEK